MRVGDQTFYFRFLAGLAEARERSNVGLEQLADGKRVRRASDDPEGYHAALNLRSRLARIAGFDKASDAARTDLETIDNVLGEVVNLLTEVRTEALAGASSTSGDAANDVRADVVRALRDQLLALANTEQGGRVLFGGTETLSTPFASDGSYSGNNSEVQAPLDTQEQIGATLSGQRVFLDGGDLFDILDQTAQALQDDRTTDVANLIPSLTTALDHVSGIRSEVGTRLQHIDRTVDRHADETLTLVRRIGEIEDIDVAEVVVNLQAADNTAEALSAAAARFLGRSLFDYLG